MKINIIISAAVSILLVGISGLQAEAAKAKSANPVTSKNIKVIETGPESDELKAAHAGKNVKKLKVMNANSNTTGPNVKKLKVIKFGPKATDAKKRAEAPKK